MQPETATSGRSADALMAATAMSLASLRADARSEPGLAVVLQVPPSDGPPGVVTALQSLARVGAALDGRANLHAVQIPEEELTHRLLTQTATQPGVLTVLYKLLLAAPGNPFFRFVATPPALAGATFREARLAFPGAVLCGFHAPQAGAATALAAGADGMTLNPPDSARLPPGARLVLLTRKDKPLRAATTPRAPAPLPKGAKAGGALSPSVADGASSVAAAAPARVLAAGFGPCTAARLVDGFAEFSPPGTHVTLLTSEPLEKGARPEAKGACRCGIAFAFVLKRWGLPGGGLAAVSPTSIRSPPFPKPKPQNPQHRRQLPLHRA